MNTKAIFLFTCLLTLTNTSVLLADMRVPHGGLPVRQTMTRSGASNSVAVNQSTIIRHNDQSRFVDRADRFRFDRDRDDRFRRRFIFVDTFDPFFFTFPVAYPYPYYSYYPYGYGYSYGYDYGYYSYNHPTYRDGSIVAQVQTYLARSGYYRGPIDGLIGPRTRFAIRAYEGAHGLRVDGSISQQLLATMGRRY